MLALVVCAKKEMFNHHLLQRRKYRRKPFTNVHIKEEKKKRERENKGKYKEIKRQRE